MWFTHAPPRLPVHFKVENPAFWGGPLLKRKRREMFLDQMEQVT